jgi:hypothetical protein
VSGLHCVGLEKAILMSVQFSRIKNEQLSAIKRAFDLQHLLDPELKRLRGLGQDLGNRH